MSKKTDKQKKSAKGENAGEAARPAPAEELPSHSEPTDLAVPSPAQMVLSPVAQRILGLVRDALSVSDGRLTPAESRSWGKALRDSCPRESHAKWEAPQDRPDPVELIREQEQTRLADLLPVRHDRMETSAFSFYRGMALVMASDLSHTPRTPIQVQCNGDAHLGNFGLFQTPERNLVFDLNDFDETAPGPWEWDVKRLATSVEVCARDRGFSEKEAREAVLTCVDSYHQAMLSFSKMGNLDVWYTHMDAARLRELVDQYGSKGERKAVDKTIDKALKKNSTRAVQKFTEVVDGTLRIVSDPPIIVPLRDMVAASRPAQLHAGIMQRVSAVMDPISQEQASARMIGLILSGYRKSLTPERCALFDSYRGVDIARKVVGVGSVGTRAWICVFEGAGPNDPLVLQIKEAEESVVERYVGKSPYDEHGQRVVEGQRATQESSDVLLGWTRLPASDGRMHDYYVRQLWDGKGSIDLTRVNPAGLARLGRLCGWTLARAHARTGNRFAIAGYLGSDGTFDQAIADFAHAYADQNQKDYQRFVQARRDGTLV